MGHSPEQAARQIDSQLIWVKNTLGSLTPEELALLRSNPEHPLWEAYDQMIALAPRRRDGLI